jgi:hypothetical protein
VLFQVQDLSRDLTTEIHNQHLGAGLSNATENPDDIAVDDIDSSTIFNINK